MTGIMIYHWVYAVMCALDVRHGSQGELRKGAGAKKKQESYRDSDFIFACNSAGVCDGTM